MDPLLPQPTRTRTIAVPLELAPSVERMVAEFERGTSETQSLQYLTPENSQKRELIHVPLLVALCTIAAAFTALVVVVIPRFEDIYKDFGFRLPEATIWVLRVSRFLNADYGWLGVWGLAIAIPIAVARLRRRRSNRWLVSIFLTVFVVGAILILTYVVLQLPMLKLIESVSSNGKIGP